VSPVKFVHILKRIEVLDRDIDELKNLDDSMQKNRSYSHALKISLELQINSLLNERVKLMELRIENPPEHLTPGQSEIDNTSITIAENRGKFKFKDFENNYLEAIEENSTSKKMQKPTTAGLNQDQIDQYLATREQQQKTIVKNEESIISQFSREEETLKTKPIEKSIPYAAPRETIKKLSREELLKNLPKANY